MIKKATRVVSSTLKNLATTRTPRSLLMLDTRCQPLKQIAQTNKAVDANMLGGWGVEGKGSRWKYP